MREIPDWWSSIIGLGIPRISPYYYYQIPSRRFWLEWLSMVFPSAYGGQVVNYSAQAQVQVQVQGQVSDASRAPGTRLVVFAGSPLFLPEYIGTC